MNKSFSAKVLILLLVVVLGGVAIFFQKGESKKALTSDVFAPVVTPAACYFQSDLDKKIAEKKTLEDVQQKSIQEIQAALGAIDATILAEEQLVAQKRELDILGEKKMSMEKPSKMAYLQAEKKMKSLTNPVVPTEPTIIAEPIVPAKPTLAAAPVVPRKPVEPREPIVPVVPPQGTNAYQYYLRVTKPNYDAAKKKYDTELKPNYDISKQAYDAAVAAKKEYDTVTKPAYTQALAAYNTAVSAKRVYDTVTKPAYDRAKKAYDTAVAAKQKYDTDLKPAYDNAVAAKNTYDTVTKPAYTQALAAYNTAVRAKRVYDTVTKPAYDRAKKAYDTAVATKQKYDDAVAEYNTLFEQYNTQLAEYNAHIAFKSALDTYTLAVIAALDKNIDGLKQNICPAQENKCSDKIDDDRDGIQDCDDSDCSEDNACKKDVVTCTEEDGIFRLEHSNGSTDFTDQIFSMGGPDPYQMSYQIEYSQNAVTFKADTYINGEKVDCPAIVVENINSENEPLETCEEILANLQAEGNEEAKAMRCTGEYAFSMTYDFKRPEEEKKNILSSFLRSDFFGSEEDNTPTTDTCDMASCYECASNQTRDNDGNCVDVGCGYGQEEVNGSCVDSCLSPQIRDASGSCVDPGCPSGQEEWNGTCVSICAPDETRNSTSGACEKAGCPEGQEEVNGTCMDPCIAPQTRQSDGTCSSGGYCGNGTVDEGEECDGGSDCDSSCKKTTNPYCGNGTTESGEECDDGNTADGDGCSAGCTNESGYCGDGGVDSGEECDDGNTSDGDGCDASCNTECEEDSGLGSNFFGFNMKWLKSDATGAKTCPIKGCTIKAAENYEGDPPTYEENQSCTCKNKLDPYQYESCRCQPTHPWCYHPKNGECVKAKFFRKAVVSLIRGAPKTCASCMTSGAASFAPIPSIPLAADFKLYKPKLTLSPKKFIQDYIATAQECR